MHPKLDGGACIQSQQLEGAADAGCSESPGTESRSNRPAVTCCKEHSTLLKPGAPSERALLLCSAEHPRVCVQSFWDMQQHASNIRMLQHEAGKLLMFGGLASAKCPLQ